MNLVSRCMNTISCRDSLIKTRLALPLKQTFY